MAHICSIEAERDRLENALGFFAALVAEDTAFLPFFLRFEEELARLIPKHVDRDSLGDSQIV